MKTIILIIAIFTLGGCANDLYTGDKGFIHVKDDAGVWHPEDVKALPVCDHDSAVYDLDKCIKELHGPMPGRR